MVVTVYTFMVGDLFHANHVRFLELAKTFGDKLIVGVLSNEAVESYKRTPIFPLEDRLVIIAAQKCVDMVVVQHTRSPLDTIKALIPDIVVHADSWKDNFPDEIEIRNLGVDIIFTPYFKGISTTEAIKICKMRKI